MKPDAIKFDIIPPSTEVPAEGEDLAPESEGEGVPLPEIKVEEAGDDVPPTSSSAHTSTQTAAPSEEAELQRSKAALRELLTDDDAMFSWRMVRDIFNGAAMANVMRNNWKFFLCLIFFSVIYVALGYMMRDKQIENADLKHTVLDRRYKALTQSAELRDRTLGSKVEKQLRDSTIRTSNERSFQLVVPKDNNE